MKKIFTLIVILLVGVLSSCKNEQEPIVDNGSEPIWAKGISWDEISDSDFTLSKDGETLLNWNNKNIVNLNMNKNAKLKKVKIIGKEPFKGCDNLSTMILSDAVHTLDVECFDGPDNMERIHLANVKYIKHEAFKEQEKLKELHLPKTIEFLDEEIHTGCDNLSVITIPNENIKYKTVNNVLYDKEMKTLLSCPPNYYGKSTFKVSDGVIKLGNAAFEYCYNIKDIICPPSLVEIGRYSFYTDEYSDLHFNTIVLQSKQVVKIIRHIEESENDNIYPIINKKTRILVPQDLLEQYRSDKAWDKLADQIEAI